MFCHMKKLVYTRQKVWNEYKFYLMNNDKLYITTQSEITHFLIEVDHCVVQNLQMLF
jgi:isoleucyl-tRNA synthetase